MHLDLTEPEGDALAKLRAILNKLRPEPAREPPAAAEGIAPPRFIRDRRRR
jgi:hypothetical protein